MSQSLVPSPMTFALDFDSAFDTENPRALVNIVPGAVAKAMQAIPGDLYELSVDDLRKKITKKDKEGRVDENIELMRTAWWIEYNRAQKTQTRFNCGNVYGGICYKKNFFTEYVGNSFNLLYMITPPVDYQVQQHRILNLSFEQEIKILKMPVMKPVYNKDGGMIGEELDTKLLQVHQKIAESMRNRLMGMPVNRTMQVNQNINGPVGSGGLSEIDQNDLESIVEELKGEKGIEGTAPRFKDVGSKE